MKNIYLISSPDKYIIDSEINKIINKNKNYDVITYDLDEKLISDVLEEINTYNLFDNKKIVIANNARFLTAERTKSLDHNLSLFENYINNPNLDNILIVTCGKVNSSKNIVKLLKEKVEFINKTEIDIYKEIDFIKEDYKIDNQTIKYLVDYLNNDNYRIINEFQKLKLYKLEEKEITIKDIDEVVIRNIDDDIFKLIDYIIMKDKKNAFLVYNSLVIKNVYPVKIMVVLANKFRLLYQVKVLSKRFRTAKEIAEIIDSHPYPVELAKKIIHRYSEKDLIKILNKLAQIDLEIKTGKVYKDTSFELFILSL